MMITEWKVVNSLIQTINQHGLGMNLLTYIIYIAMNPNHQAVALWSSNPGEKKHIFQKRPAAALPDLCRGTLFRGIFCGAC